VTLRPIDPTTPYPAATGRAVAVHAELVGLQQVVEHGVAQVGAGLVARVLGVEQVVLGVDDLLGLEQVFLEFLGAQTAAVALDLRLGDVELEAGELDTSGGGTRADDDVVTLAVVVAGRAFEARSWRPAGSGVRCARSSGMLSVAPQQVGHVPSLKLTPAWLLSGSVGMVTRPSTFRSGSRSSLR
jgi:hypothetical protein